MTTYTVQKVGDPSAITLHPQPTTTGIQATRRTIGADGGILEEGHYIELKWDVLSKAHYQQLLEDFGLDDSLTQIVTVEIRDEFFEDVTKEGIAVRPEMGKDVEWKNSRVRDVTILVKELEEV